MRKFNSLILLLLFILSINFTYAQNSKNQKKKDLKATVIAQENFPFCFWHPCWVQLIVRLDNGKQETSSYALVTIEYFPDAGLPEKGFPSELNEQAKKWEFKAIRYSNRTERVRKYLTVIDSKTQKDISDKAALPAWILLPGAENENIPVSKVLRHYLVKSGEYKEFCE